MFRDEEVDQDQADKSGTCKDIGGVNTPSLRPFALKVYQSRLTKRPGLSVLTVGRIINGTV